MSGVQDSLEIRFRLIDGSDIGPKSFPAAASVASLKESILSQWPKVGECRSVLCDVPGGIITMHVVVSQPPQEKGTRSQMYR
ncbi:hypothetical protein E3N88_12528 [Mikania micrantha]|uniref:UBL3-like ubiquitin domain-containing protein n=1 Tax=Mikania micrantha TaxID=192012 RepID=A0A5N6P739_9ASTR|nr:hypothetical protein E3N88_12528 [Mikania micrantha]